MRLSDIDLRLLRVFKAVADAGGVVKAKSILGVNQPTISAHLANLEKRLDVRLCNRGPKGFSLTPEGEDVLRETDQLLEYIDSYTQKLNEIGRSKVQPLRVGLVDCLATDPQCPIHYAVRQTQTALPKASINLGIYDFLDCLTELRAGRLDIAILGLEEKLPEDVEAVHLYDEPSGLFCAPSHPCALAASKQELNAALKNAKISAHSFVVDPLGGELELGLFEEEADVSQGHIEATAHLILAGTHVGLIPVHFAKHWVTSGEMIHVAEDTHSVTSQIFGVRVKGASRNEASECFWKALVRRSS